MMMNNTVENDDDITLGGGGEDVELSNETGEVEETSIHNEENSGISNNKNNNSNTVSSSRVLLLRNLSSSVTETDVEGLVRPFTKNHKPKIYLQASAGRAFVEFADEESAKNALNYFRVHPVQLRGVGVNVTLSKRESVITINENANNINDPFKILLASVTNLLYLVDIDLIHFLFSKYGTVEKIVTFSKSSSMFQALIQFKYPHQAKNALVALHNRNIYDGCNTLQIQPSRLTDLIVKSNSSRSFDYTVAGANSHDVNGAGGSSGNFAKYNGGMGPGVLPTPNTMPNNYNYGVGHTPSGASYMGGGMMGGGRGGMPAGGLYANANNNMISFIDKLPKEIRDMNIETCNKNQTPVVICYHLPQDITVQKLFNLFSLYGTVIRIKILRDKPDTALVQYSDPFYASLAYNFLQNARVMGNELQIAFSINHEVKLPASSSNHSNSSSSWNNRYPALNANIANCDVNHNDEQESVDTKTKTFQVKDQRYGQGDDIEKYVKGASRPTGTLFVANVPENATEAEIRKIFSVYGNVHKVVFKPPRENVKTQMVVVAMNNEAQALNALMNLHNTPLHSRYIKVAFSKTVVN